MVQEELDFTLDEVSFYTDSKVVLGYIFNDKRRFYVYVHNRLERIRCSTQAHQWHYVSTHLNPADDATRVLPTEHLSHSTWLSGPSFLTDPSQGPKQEVSFDLIYPKHDTELHPEVVSCATSLSKDTIEAARFERFSSWSRPFKTIARLRHIVTCFKAGTESRCHGWHACDNNITEENSSSRPKPSLFMQCKMRCMQMTSDTW